MPSLGVRYRAKGLPSFNTQPPLFIVTLAIAESTVVLGEVIHYEVEFCIITTVSIQHLSECIELATMEFVTRTHNRGDWRYKIANVQSRYGTFE